MKGLKLKIFIVIVFCLVLLSIFLINADAQGFILGLMLGSTLSEESEKNISSDCIYLDKEILKNTPKEELIKELRYVLISMYSNYREGETIQEIFEGKSNIKKQIEKYTYKWIAIIKVNANLLFYYILYPKI